MLQGLLFNPKPSAPDNSALLCVLGSPKEPVQKCYAQINPTYNPVSKYIKCKQNSSCNQQYLLVVEKNTDVRFVAFNVTNMSLFKLSLI